MANSQILPSVVPPTTPTPPTTPASTPQQSQGNGGFFGFLSRIPGDIARGISDIPVIGKALGTALSWASKPLQEIQKDYRFIHNLYAEHGFGAGILGTLGVLGGGTIGFLTGFGPAGAALGAEAGAALTTNLLGRAIPAYQDSFNKANDPTSQVSFGRDLAHGLSLIPGFKTLSNTNTGFGQIVSGIADAAFDFRGDPIATAGKLKAAIKNGDYIAVPRMGEEGEEYVHPTTGKPVGRATLPLASSGLGMQKFLLANSAVVQTPEQLDMILANPLQTGVRRAFQDIVNMAQDKKTGLGNIATTYGAKYGWSRNTMVAMSKVAPGDEGLHQLTQIVKESLYSKVLADKEDGATGEFRLPSKTVGKLLSEKIGLDRIRNSQQATTWDEERNLLLPARVPATEPILDESGKPTLDENGKPQVRNITDAQGNLMWKLSRPAFTTVNRDVWMNALAAKVRTFTNTVPLSLDTKTLELSNREIDFADPAVAKTLQSIGNLSLTNRQTLEHVTKILTMNNDIDRLNGLRTLNQEIIKARGLGDTTATAILGEHSKAIMGNEFENGNYGFDHQGNPINQVEMAPEQGGGYKSIAITQGQRYKGQMIDLKDLRDAVRQTKAYSALYAKGDDWFTRYTNLVFAPLTLLSSAFGLRVSAGEALHQIMRRGLGKYLNAVLATSIRRLDAKSKAQQDYKNDAIAMALPETVKDAIESEQKTGVEKTIRNTEVTDELNQVEKNAKYLYQKGMQVVGSKESWNKAVNNTRDFTHRLLPAGWPVGQFAKDKLTPFTAKKMIQVMDKFHDLLGIDGSPAAVAGGHTSSQDLWSKEQIDMFTKSLGHSHIPGQELAGLTKTDPHYHDYLAKNLGMAGADKAQRDIAKDYIRLNQNADFANLPEDKKWAIITDNQTARIKNPNMYKDYRSTLDGYTKAIPESFAQAQTSHLRGLVQGADGTVHTDLIKKVANGDNFIGKDLRKKDINTLPVIVLGRRVQQTMSDGLRRAEEFGFRRFVTPVIDNVSRQPLFADFLTRRYIKNEILFQKGLISEDELMRKSAIEATREMIPAIHSPAIRSQFAVLHRNLLPFYFAQEQAMRRTGRLIMSNPQAFRDFQIIQQGLNNPGFVHTDSNGQKYIVYPIVGEFGNAIVRGLNTLGFKQFTGLPESISGTTNSLLTVLPELKFPSVGPFVNMGVTELAKMFPWMDKVANVATGGYPAETLLQAIMPNSTMRDIWNAMTMDERVSAVYNSKISAIAAAYYHGNLPENYATLPPEQQAKYLDMIQHNAQSNLLIKGLMSFFLPLSPNVSNDYYDKNLQSLRSEYLQLLKTVNPATKKPYTLAEALDKFIKDNGQRAVSYTISSTKSGTSGATVPLSDQALAWINTHQGLINDPRYSIAAPYLIPQTASTPDALSVEKQLLADHFRSKVTPQEFMSSLYIQKGWQDIATSYADYKVMMEAARKTGNRQQMYQISQLWKQYTDNYGLSNPIWYSDYNNPIRLDNAQNAVSQLMVMNENKLIPNTVEGNGIKSLLASYADFHDALIQNTLPGGRHTPMYANIQDQWYTYLDGLAASEPRLQSVINGVFRRVK